MSPNRSSSTPPAGRRRRLAVLATGLTLGAAGLTGVAVLAPPVLADAAYAVAAAPAVSQISPDNGPLGGGTTVTIAGTGFTGATAVRFGDTAVSFTVDSCTFITATSPVGDPGPVDVTVTTPAGTSAITSNDRFAYTYDFIGFFAPVDNLPTVNTVRAGRGIPVRFSLGGDKGLSILAAGSPSSQPTACGDGDTDPVETTSGARPGLTYDASTGRYTYVWKTDKDWAGTCRVLHLMLTDGTDQTAVFQFS